MAWLAEAWRRALDTCARFGDAAAWHALEKTCEHNVAAHGDAREWLAAVDSMPEATGATDIDATICIGHADDLPQAQRNGLDAALLALRPWRKGPFSLFGTHVDTEWRSDWKWARVARHVANLRGRRVLDVGCGNGYYGWRMCEAGARAVVGLDPTILYVMQYAAIGRYVARARPQFANAVLPLRLEDTPGSGAFDTVFSMGVLYHRRDTHDHLQRLRAQLVPGGELVLETLVIPNEPTASLVPRERYARMRNVWEIPGTERLLGWLAGAGFADARVVDATATTADEQRATPWMTGESLVDGLDPADPSRTIEGYPAPIRAIVIARV